MAPKDEKPDGFSVSRRNFLKSTGVVGLAAAVVSPSEAEAAQAGPAAVGPGDVPVRLMVNGKTARSDDRAARHAARRAAHARRPHRQQARLRSRRVRRLHDDRRRPHGLLVLDARDRSAGQADSHRRRPGQRRDAASGAAGVLRQGRADVRVLHAGLRHGERRRCSRSIPTPTPEQIKKGLDGNICRCGTFSRIFEAVSSVKGVTRG